MFETFPRLTGLFDPISGRRAFTELNVREHVIDTGERTLALSEVASVSVGVDERWPVKMALLALACALAAGAVFYPWVGIIAVLLVVSAVFVRSTSTLEIATNDGSRTVFTSDTRSELDAALAFLTEKLNTSDAAMTRQFRFSPQPRDERSAEAGQSRVAETVGDADDDDTTGAGARPSADAGTDQDASRTTSTTRFANGLAGLGGGGLLRGRTPRAEAADADRGAGDGASAGSSGHIDYAPVLTQVMELHRFYAKTPDTKHIEQRLSEMEVLMRSGTPTGEGRERIRQLAGELSSIMQAYPPMVQLFQQIATLATPTRSAAA